MQASRSEADVESCVAQSLDASPIQQTSTVKVHESRLDICMCVILTLETWLDGSGQVSWTHVGLGTTQGTYVT